MLNFFDTEFLQNGSGKVVLVSLGIVREDGATFYMESSEFSDADANDWVKQNVLPKLGPKEKRVTRVEMKKALIEWVGDDIPVWVAYYAAYDAVCLFEMLSVGDTEGKGSFALQPQGWPKIVWDLKQDILKLGNPELPKQDEKGGHNALADAQWLKDVFWFLHGKFGLTIPVPQPKVPDHHVAAAVETYNDIMRSLGFQTIIEMIGDNTVDNLVADVRRTVSVEVSQFVVGLLNGSVNQFAYAYRTPQYDEFKRALENLSIRYKVMDGMEQGDVCQKITALFKEIFTASYGSLGPEAADLMAVKYAKQMIDYLKAQTPQAADLSITTPKVY